jgi:Phosphoglycerate dehydrogenase and related dehydrogenases
MKDIRVVMSTLDFSEEHMRKIREAFQPAKFIQLDKNDRQGIAEAAKKADVALLNADVDDTLLAAPNLKWVHCDHAGVEKSANQAVFDRGLFVTSSAGRSGPALAEHCMFFMLNFAYNFPAFYEAQKEHQYGGIEGQGALRALYGRTVGILGMGYTGRELAVRAHAFGMQVLAYRRRDGILPGVDKMYSADKGDTIDELIKESDFIALALPLSDATYHLIDESKINLMKKSAVIVNLGRGNTIDEPALINALKEGRIAGAGLDTFAKEPLPQDSELWELPNVLLTPHFTPALPDKTDRSVNVICENVKRFREGQPMINLMTKEDLFTLSLD